MLTIFHTADWHLGQQFHGYDRDYEHCCFLDWLLAELRQQRPDALFVAGDVFDSINPSAQSQQRLYSFLARAHAALPELQIVATAGNHDAGARLEAPASVLESLNVTVVGTIQRDDKGAIDVRKLLVPLHDAAGVVRAIVMAVPFLRPSDVPQVKDAVDPYPDGIRELYRLVTEAARTLRSQLSPAAALVAMGHCHLHGGEESSDSERRLIIGGAEALAKDIFAEDIAYVALGHLHKAQQISSGRIRYSGSPIPLSFSEAGYRHRLWRLSLQDQQLAAVDEVAIPRSVQLMTIPKRTSIAVIDEVLLELQQLIEGNSHSIELQPYLEVRVAEHGPDPTRRKRIEQALAGKAVRLASIKLADAARQSTSVDVCPASDQVALSSINPEEVFLSAHREKFGGLEASDGLIAAFRAILLQEPSAS